MARKTFPADERALLAAVHEAPADDAPRLVYADWLEEHGHAEFAEFVRWQVAHPAEMAIPRPSAGTRARWREEAAGSAEERMRRWLGLNHGTWGRPCPGEADLAAFARGLPVARVKWVIARPAGLDRLLAAASPRLRFRVPLDESTLPLLDHPVFVRADAVSLCPVAVGATLGEDSIAALARWPRIGAVRAVQLWRVRDPDRARGRFPAGVAVDVSAA